MKQILLMIAVLCMGGCAPSVPDTAKEKSQCPYCKEFFPSTGIMVHKLKCPDKDGD